MNPIYDRNLVGGCGSPDFDATTDVDATPLSASGQPRRLPQRPLTPSLRSLFGPLYLIYALNLFYGFVL